MAGTCPQDGRTTAGTPLVLLHGVGLDRTMWEPVVDRLNREPIALDLPGHGQQQPLHTDATLAGFAQDILERMPDCQVHLVGFSLGALVAQYIARHAPGRVRSLTCVSTVCRRTDVEREAVLDRLRLAQTDFLATVDRSIDRWYPTGTTVAADWVVATRRTLAGNDHDDFVRAYRVFAIGDAELAPELSGITVPVLAITGEKDSGSTPDMTHRLVAAVPDARARIVPGARHMLPVEAPDVLAVELTTFIDDVEGENQ